MNQFYYQSIHYLSNYLAVTLLFNWPMSRKFRHTSPSSFSFAISPWINCTMYLFDCFITKVNFKGIWKGYAFKVDLCYKKSTRRMQIQVHSTLRTTYDWQTKKQTTEQHTLVQPPIQQKRQHQYRTQFLALVDKHAPKDHKLRKIFNRNTITISSAAWITPNRSSTATTNAF